MTKRRTTIRGGTFTVTENPALVKNVRRLKDEDPANVRVEEGVTPPVGTFGDIRSQSDLAQTVDCRRCFTEVGGFLNVRMFLCPTCGNKRCPKATDHRLECTGSNEPGQEGSDYA